jgi:GAF domain/ANTAR domain
MTALATTCVDGAGVDGCGVSIRDTSANRVMVHATNAVAAAIEDLQLTLGEGPCVDVARSGSAVLVADLADMTEGIPSHGWPVFRNEASSLGVGAVFAFPILVGSVALGVVDLYRTAPGVMSRAQLTSTLSTVDSMGRYLLHADDDGSQQNSPLSLVVHQAAGVVMVQLDSSIEEALVRLRASAYAAGRPVADIAAEVVQGKIRFRKEQA